MLKGENVLWRAALGYLLRKHRYVVAFSLPMSSFGAYGDMALERSA